MKRFALTLIVAAAAGTAACQGGTNNSADVNGAAIGQSVENGLEDVGNVASEAGDVIENNAKAAWNEVKETARDLTNGAESNTATTTTTTNTTTTNTTRR